jgi:hypothetical protein
VSKLYLWTPIADSLKAYRSRLLYSPSSHYEHVWRLIHINESIVLFLGLAITSRILSLKQEESKKLLQVLLTNHCLNKGSIGAWIDFLSSFKNHANIESCAFLSKAYEYLNKKLDHDLYFLNGLERIESNQGVKRNDKFTRIARLRIINDLRNKLAHVPISVETFECLHIGLKQEILHLFLGDKLKIKSSGDVFDPLEIEKFYSNVEEILKGGIISNTAMLTGEELTPYGEVGTGAESSIMLKWSNLPPWPAGPFFRITQSFKPLLLARIKQKDIEERILSLDEAIEGEFHRTAAEVEPVSTLELEKQNILEWHEALKAIRQQKEEEEAQEEKVEIEVEIQNNSDQVIPNPSDVRAKALRLKYAGDYAGAVEQFKEYINTVETLANNSSGNTVGQDILAKYINETFKREYGICLWRKANKLTEDNEEKEEEFKEAITKLEEATKHAYPSEAAKAYYELSKAHYYYYQHFQSGIDKAVESAQKALDNDFQDLYLTWRNKLETAREMNSLM